MWRKAFLENNLHGIISESARGRVLCNIRYPPETHHNLKSREISLAVSLPCSVQNFKMIRQLDRMLLWTNGILRDCTRPLDYLKVHLYLSRHWEPSPNHPWPKIKNVWNTDCKSVVMVSTIVKFCGKHIVLFYIRVKRYCHESWNTNGSLW